jgi:thiol-disulfide isomerase/thioredoxin
MAVASLVIALLACAPLHPSPLADSDLDQLVGHIELRDIQGRVWQRRDLAGRVVLVDVWATWCAPCLAELPTLKRLNGAYGDRLVMLGISLDTLSRRDFMSWLSRHDVTWPQIFDGRGYSGSVARRLGITSVPASWLFDASGSLAGRDLRGGQLERAVRELVVIPR